ncbi:MAG: thioredoxin family protein [Anaerolineae bacterium]
MEIKILGSGCPNCKRLEALTRQVVEELGVEATLGHVREMSEIMTYDVFMTPALVIDEKVMASGRIPRKDEIRTWIQEAQA